MAAPMDVVAMETDDDDKENSQLNTVCARPVQPVFHFSTENAIAEIQNASRGCEPSFLQSNTEDTIDFKASRYVQTDILQEAIEVLEDKGVVILSGPPGCGKTYQGHALLRYYRKQGYTPYLLPSFKQWNKHVVAGKKCVVLMDKIFGTDCVDRKEHNNWALLRETVTSFISGRDCKLVVSMNPHVLREFLQLEEDIASPFLNPSVTVNMNESLDIDQRAEILDSHLKELHLKELPARLPESERRTLVGIVLQKDVSGPVFGWCCKWMVCKWGSIQDPSAIFTHPAEAYVPLLQRMLREPSFGRALAAFLCLAMQKCLGQQSHAIMEALRHLEFFESISYDRLADFADLMRGFILNSDSDDFYSRVLYDAAGLALCRSFRLPVLLKACDIIFLVQNVRTVDSATILSATIRRQDESLLIKTFLRHILNGQAESLCQHPDFGSDKFFKKFQASCEDRGKEIVGAKDAKYSLPLMYWAAWNPSPNLAAWCSQFFASSTGGSTESSLSVAVAVAFLSNSLGTEETAWVKKFFSSLRQDFSRFQNIDEKIILKLPFPDPIIEGTACLLATFKTQLETQGVCYLGNAFLPIPPRMMSVTLTDTMVVVETNGKDLQLVLRMLSDRKADDTDDGGNTLLHMATEVGNLDAIITAVKSGADLSFSNNDGKTPYSLAQLWRKENKDCLDNRETDSRLRFVYGQRETDTRFLSACSQRQTDTAKVLLCQSASVNAQDDNETALLKSSRAGAWSLTDILIQLGADVNSSDKTSGRRALHYACESGQSNIINLLLAKGADVNAKDKAGKTALSYACEFGDMNTVRLLLENGADTSHHDDIATGNGGTKRGRCFDSEKSSGFLYHKRELQTELLSETGDHLSFDENEDFHTDEYEIKELFDLTTGLFISSARNDYSNCRGKTALHIASDLKKTETADLLIRHGAKISAQSANGATALHLACKSGHAETVKLLLDKGGDPLARDKFKETPLHWASSFGQTEAASLVIERGTDINIINFGSFTPLHCACRQGQKETVRLLIDRGANINIKGYRNGDTPLHLASTIDQNENCQKADLDNSDELLHKDCQREKALIRTIEENKSEIVHLLLEQGAQVNTTNRNGDTSLHSLFTGTVICESVLHMLR